LNKKSKKSSTAAGAPSGVAATRLDLAKVKAFIALVRKSMDPAALQLVLGVVLFAAIQGYAQAQGKADAEANNSNDADQSSADQDALVAINDAFRDGHITEAERLQLQALLGVDFSDAILPEELRWLVAQIANAPTR
jgi:hypothetical protein